MEKPEISIATCFDYSIPLHEQIPLIAEAGFTHLSLGHDEEHSGIHDAAKRKKLKTQLNRHNLKIDTVHGPPLNRPDSPERLEKTVTSALDLSVPVVVVHPVPFEIEESAIQDNQAVILRTLEEILPLLRETGIKLAVENVMPGPVTELTVRVIRQADPDYIGFCYDSAHDQIDGPRPFILLDLLKDRVIAVHLSDRVREFADHVPPGEGFIDWEGLTSALKKTVFTGPLLFEVMVEHSSVKEPEQFLKLAYERACWVHSMICNT
jgi:sugar phosphate isomerase/epimerase